MNEITRKTVYQFRGVSYDTLAQACDAAEDLCFKILRNDLLEIGFTANDASKVAKVLVDNRIAYSRMLDYQLPTPEGNK